MPVEARRAGVGRVGARAWSPMCAGRGHRSSAIISARLLPHDAPQGQR